MLKSIKTNMQKHDIKYDVTSGHCSNLILTFLSSDSEPPMFDDDDSDNNVASKDDDLFKPISKLNSKPAKEKKPAAKKPAAEKKPKAPPKKKAEKKGIVSEFV